MKVKGLRQEIVRLNGKKDVFDYTVRHIEGNKYECPELGFTFNAETGETSKKRLGEKENIKIGEWAGERRKIRYTLIEEAQEAKAETAPSTLVEEWKREDGTVEVHKEYKNGQLWEKGSYRRLYLDSYGRGAYVDLKTNTFHPDRRKSFPVGEWIKEWSAKVEYRFVLR